MEKVDCFNKEYNYIKDNKKREESKNWNKFIEKYGLLVYETVEKI